MASLPIYKSADVPFALMQTAWAQQLNPLIGSPLAGGNLLKSVNLSTGANIVNHKLSKKLTGWFVTRFHGAWAQIYDTQDNNATPDLTLLLHTSSNVLVDIYVF